MQWSAGTYSLLDTFSRGKVPCIVLALELEMAIALTYLRQTDFAKVVGIFKGCGCYCFH